MLVGLSVLYLTLPLVVFAYGWLRYPISFIILSILLFFIIIVFHDIAPSFSSIYVKYWASNDKIDQKRLLVKLRVVFVVIAIWLLLSGIGGFGYQTTDYLASNALLKDLIERPWPLTTEWSSRTVPVVYYLGWYLPAAVTGKLFGWVFANIFILVWAFFGVTLSFGWFINLCAVQNITSRKLLVTLSVFCLAGGLDFVGYYFLRGNSFDIYNVFPLDGWSFLQYSSNTTLIYWVPQHTIPAWLITGLVMNCIFGRWSNIKYLGMGLAGSLLSSSFSVMGIFPYLLVLLAVIWRKRRWKLLFSVQNVSSNLLAIPVAIVVILYLSSNKVSFPIGFLWTFTDSSLVYWGWLEFLFIEIGFLSISILIGIWINYSTSFIKPDSIYHYNTILAFLDKRYGMSGLRLILISVTMMLLAFLPAYKMGYADDFVMRASIPALFIFWSFINKVLIDSTISKNVELRAYFIVIVCLVLIGFYNSLAQISISVRNYHFGAPDEDSVLTVATGSLPWVVEQRLGSTDSLFYRYIGK